MAVVRKSRTAKAAAAVRRVVVTNNELRRDVAVWSKKNDMIAFTTETLSCCSLNNIDIGLNTSHFVFQRYRYMQVPESFFFEAERTCVVMAVPVAGSFFHLGADIGPGLYDATKFGFVTWKRVSNLLHFIVSSGVHILTGYEV